MQIKSKVSTEKLINRFKDMAKRESLLTGITVSQEDLLIQIIGTIIAEAMDEE